MSAMSNTFLVRLSAERAEELHFDTALVEKDGYTSIPRHLYEIALNAEAAELEKRAAAPPKPFWEIPNA